MRRATEAEQDCIKRLNARLIDAVKAELMSGEVSKPEVLALFAYITGLLVGLQDQRTMPPDEAMELVGCNIVKGNAAAIDQMFSGPGGTA